MSMLQSLKNWISPGDTSPDSTSLLSRGAILSGGRQRAVELDKNISSFRHDEEWRLKHALIAKENGLEAKDYALPFPGNQTTVHKTNGVLGPLLGTAALLAAGTLAYKACTAPPAPPTPPPAPIVQQGPGFDASVDVEVIPPQATPAQ